MSLAALNILQKRDVTLYECYRILFGTALHWGSNSILFLVQFGFPLFVI